MTSLRKKLAFSYGLLIVITCAVSAWSIYHLVRLDRAIDLILVDNYKSIKAAENMKEALEREDSAAMFFIASHADRARQQFAANDKIFAAQYDIAAGNVTEPGESEIVVDIKARYAAYRTELERFLNPAAAKADEQSGVYFARLEPNFIALKTRLDDLLRINQQAMVAANDRASAVSKRAEISTAITAVLALTLAFVFAWRFTHYVVDPITDLTEKARRIGEGDFDQSVHVISKDEIGVLATEFNRMRVRLRDLRKSDYGRLLVEQKKADAVIDSIYEPVIVTDAQGRVTKINKAARALFSHESNAAGDGDISLSGVTGGERILSAVRDAVRMQRPVAAEGEAALVPIKIGNAAHSFRLRATPMRDDEGRLLGAVTVLEDITAMTELDQLKTEFISVASARLREPLHALRLALHAMAEGYVGELSGTQGEMLGGARENAEKLDELIGDLLALTEIETGALKLATERLRPTDLARAALDRFQAAADSKEIKLENRVWPDLPWVVADRRAVARVFDNLLSNAIRHTERDGSITIEASEHAGQVFFSVRDTGCGIAEEHLAHVFGRFAHIDKEAGGTGLGLALVKQLVETQGGQVSVESRVGEGSTFSFTLPEGGPASVRPITSAPARRVG
jgi:signal transduction histidine kinase